MNRREVATSSVYVNSRCHVIPLVDRILMDSLMQLDTCSPYEPGHGEDTDRGKWNARSLEALLDRESFLLCESWSARAGNQGGRWAEADLRIERSTRTKEDLDPFGLCIPHNEISKDHLEQRRLEETGLFVARGHVELWVGGGSARQSGRARFGCCCDRDRVAGEVSRNRVPDGLVETVVVAKVNVVPAQAAIVLNDCIGCISRSPCMPLPAGRT